MPYAYIEHVSDIGIRAAGADLLSAFESGVEAMLNVMFDLTTIGEAEGVAIRAEAFEIDLLFVEVLNEVLSLQGVEGLALRRLEAKDVSGPGDKGYSFSGTAFGERFDPARHVVRTEVKGATYSGLRYVRGEAGEHIFECVLDV
jgi:SHS2 domain-containing protein